MKKIFFLLLPIFFCIQAFSQTDIHALMERRDLPLAEIEVLAAQYFKIAGTGQGSGYKQYQRWLYEQHFHLDANGFITDPQSELTSFDQAVNTMNAMGATSGAPATAGIWNELGPWGWNRTSGWNPGTGRLTAVAVQPSNQNIIYVGSPGGGLWKTINGGTNWTPLSEYNSVWMNIYSIAIDPLDPNIVYAGTGNSGNQVIRSTDAGATWTILGSGPTGTIRKILIHPTSTNIVFACASNGIFRSVNSGTTWTSVQNTTKEDIEFKPGNPSIMYASGTSQVVKSSDGGLSWSILSSSVGITNTGRTLISVTAANPEYLYVVQASGSIFGRMYKSVNSGVSFTTTIIGSATSGTNFFGYETNGTGTTGQATYDMGMTVSPTNANEVHIAGIICWKSTNGGTSFTATTAWSLPNSLGYNHADVHGLEFVNANIYSISDGGLYKSTNNAGDWTDLSAGLGIRQFYRIASSPTNGTVITGGAQDNGSVAKQSNGTWVDWLGADGMEGLVSPTNHLNIWGTSQNGQLYKSTNGGNSRTSLAQITGGAWVTPIAIHPTNETILFAGGTAVYKSTNSGSTFTSISGTTISNALGDLAVAPSNANYIYASYSSSLYVTTNGGTNWTTYIAPGVITDICVSPSNPSKIWITTSSGLGRVFTSVNNGQNFTNITGVLPLLSGRTIVVDNTTDEKLFVGMNLGVYTYSNSSPSWTVMTDNLPLVAINELDIQFSTNKLRVATYGRGVWETSLASTACNAPSGLVASALTFTSATLSWTAVPGALSYTVEYKAASSSTWIVLTAATPSISINLTGLLQGTIYDFRIRTICPAGLSLFTQAQFSTTAPSPACINMYEPNATLATAPTIPVNTLVSAGIGTTTDVDYYKIITTTFVDFNIALTNLPNDYELELLNTSGTPMALSSNGGTTSESIVSFTQPPGTYYIKVSGYSGAMSMAQCYDLFVGTTVVSACATPTGLSTTIVAGTTATFNWNTVAGAVSYKIQYKVVGSSTWTTANAATNFYNATGLQYNTNYEWQVRTMCASDSSVGTSSTLFTTLLNCSAVPGSSFSNPIVVGVAPCTAGAYVNTQTNSTANCFLNNYTGSNNQSSPNIWYQFTLLASSTVQLSHCGSTLSDTYIHLLNSAGTQLLSNDDNGPLCSGLRASISTTIPAGTYYVVSEGYGTGVGSIITTISTTNPCNTILNLTLFLEGYYAGAGTMSSVMLNEGYTGSPLPTATDVDDILIELRSNSNPATIIATDSARLQTNGLAVCNFPPLSGSYYIVVKHRNTLQTWSKNPLSMSTGVNTYNFSIAASQAYGDNQVEKSPGVWTLYSGELIQDGNIDLFDLSEAQNAVTSFLFGYVAADINGDGNVDLLDIPEVESNVINFIFSNHP